jgi:ribosomal-protein-alanine N-acetyltransferase
METAFKSFPVIETERLSLRKIHTADARAVFAILSEEVVAEFYDDDPYSSVSEALEQIGIWEWIFTNRRGIRWGITLKSGGGLIGTCGFYAFHRLHLRAGIGYELAPIYWRQGVMTEALSAILDYGFGEMGLNRIEASVMPGNIASIRLLEGLGFTKEGLLSQYEHWGSKGFVDLVMYSLLNSKK